MPPEEEDLALRKAQDLERHLREQASARAASTTHVRIPPTDHVQRAQIIERLDKIIDLLAEPRVINETHVHEGTPKPKTMTINYSSAWLEGTFPRIVVKGEDVVRLWREAVERLNQIEKYIDLHGDDEPEAEPAKV